MNTIETLDPTPFKHLVMSIGALPTSFVDSMSYYECMAWLVAYIRDNVVPACNNNAEAIEEIQQWIETLDLQDEVDHKLDEMAASGELAEIISQYLNSAAIFAYDNVADMKAAENLIDGSYARTLGYHTKNDGGSGLYKIRTVTNDDIVDDTFIVEMGDGSDQLVAELILENDIININALGADNTGANDSSAIFNRAFEYINAKWVAGDYNVNTVECAGKYLWNSQVSMPPCARLRGSGYVTILTNVSGSALKIKYLSATLPSNPDGNHQDWLIGELISFDRGGLIKNIGTNLTNTCIEIGNDSNEDVYHAYARYKLCNFRIYNYNIGILHNRYNVYIGRYENISFEGNNVGVQYGVSAATVNNSGEEFTYDNCLFATETNAVKWFTDGFDSVFTNCSFDFITTVFNKASTQGYTRINVTGCHFEGFTHIIDGMKFYDYLTISQSGLLFTQDTDKISINSDNGCISINQTKFMPDKNNISDPTKLVDKTAVISEYDNYFTQQNLYYGMLKANLVQNGFDNVATGTVDVNVNSTIGDWKVVGNNSTFTGEIVQDNYLYTGHKSLVIKVGVENANNKNFHLESKEFIPIDSIRRKLCCNDYKYNVQGGGNITVYYYDENQVEISHDSGYHEQHSATAQNTWYMSPFAHIATVPSNAKYGSQQETLGSLDLSR